MDWGVPLDWCKDGGVEGSGVAVKSIRVEQGTEKSSVGRSQLEDKEV